MKDCFLHLAQLPWKPFRIALKFYKFIEVKLAVIIIEWKGTAFQKQMILKGIFKLVLTWSIFKN